MRRDEVAGKAREVSMRGIAGPFEYAPDDRAALTQLAECVEALAGSGDATTTAGHRYRCACCELATFEHPTTEECASVDGKCEHLVRAGWQPVWLRGYMGAVVEEPAMFSRGAWVCRECVRRFT